MTTIQDLLDKKQVQVMLNSQIWELECKSDSISYIHGYLRFTLLTRTEGQVRWLLSADNNLLRGGCKPTDNAEKLLNTAVHRLLKRLIKSRQTCTTTLRDIEVSIYLLTTL